MSPNQVAYRSGFDGLDADVLFVWRHNSISQNVILKERPVLPDGMDPATTRLEVVSELVESPEPVLNAVVLKKPGESDFIDDVTIGLGSLLAMRGKAYPVNGAQALVLTGGHLADDSAVPVAKEFRQLDDGRKFIIESVGWQEIEPLLKDLTTAMIEQSPRAKTQLADSRVWPNRIAPLATKQPLQVASQPYHSRGFLVDIDLSGSVSSYTFLSGTTYYIAQSFYISGTSTTTFQPGCVIKYGNDAWLLVHCPFSFAPTGQMMPVLTSKDDDVFGQMISGSTHNPTYMARQALLVYYVVESQTEIKNMRIRWAKKGIEYDAYTGVEFSHNLTNFLFQQCQTNVYASMPDGALTFSNVKYCNATRTLEGSYGYLSGSMTKDCGPLYNVANFGGVLEQSTRDSIPDTMGAVGPSHFMEILNGSSSPSVAVYDKYSGAVRATATPETLFSVTVPSGPYAGSYPTGPIDSRLIYDHQSQRWIASTIDAVFGHVVLAVSNGPDPVGNGGATWVADNWKKYLVPFGTNCGTDFDILGVDGNGIYITATTAQSCNGNVAALPKSPLVNYDPTNPPPVVQDRHILRAPLGDYVFPAVNFDPVTTNDPIWFIAATSGSIYYNSLKWTGGFNNPPVWQFASPSPSLAITPSFATPLPAPQLAGGSHKVSVRLLSALMTASARSVGGVQYVWACRTIAVNRSGNADGGGVDRNAVEWFKIQMTPNVSIVASNRIYDTAVTSPNFYYMPSLAVNKNGDVVTGFSGSSVNDYIGAYYSGMLASGNSPSPPIRYFAGKDWFGGPFGSFPAWGDYSYTSLDPDGLTIWTIQEYAETRYDPQLFNAFGTRIAAITPF